MEPAWGLREVVTERVYRHQLHAVLRPVELDLTQLRGLVACALAAGHGLDEHDSPGDATVHVLHGRVRLRAGDDGWEGSAGDLLIVPTSRHSLDALEDSAVLLTVGKRG